jgi:hypothetical protein
MLAADSVMNPILSAAQPGEKRFGLIDVRAIFRDVFG